MSSDLVLFGLDFTTLVEGTLSHTQNDRITLAVSHEEVFSSLYHTHSIVHPPKLHCALTIWAIRVASKRAIPWLSVEMNISFLARFMDVLVLPSQEA